MPRSVRTVRESVRRTGAASSRRKRTLHGRFGRVGLSLIAGTLVVALLATDSSALGYTIHTYAPPYKGTAFATHRTAAAGGCGASTNYLAPSFNLSSGVVKSSASASATACNKSTSTGSSASVEIKVGVALASFKSDGGKYVVRAHWSMDFTVSLSLTGATCSDPGQAAQADVEFSAYFVNVTAGGKLILGASTLFSHAISTTGSSSWTTNVQHNLTWSATLGTNDTYEIATGISFDTAVSVNNGDTTDKDACAATADLTRSSGSAFATLDKVALVDY